MSQAVMLSPFGRFTLLLDCSIWFAIGLSYSKFSICKFSIKNHPSVCMVAEPLRVKISSDHIPSKMREFWVLAFWAKLG